MALPFFYISEFDPQQTNVVLDENNSRHVVQVLRMKTGAQLHLTDGRGHLVTATIISDHKKHCTLQVDEVLHKNPIAPRVAIAIAPLKNTGRFEWFLEKATEIGITEIMPVITARTEKEKFRQERWVNILISAMLQSQQCYLPQLHAATGFEELLKSEVAVAYNNKLIAHCLENEKQDLCKATDNTLILIGPEGDFTEQEIALALESGYNPVTLGSTRLRTETAGMVAAALLRV